MGVGVTSGSCGRFDGGVGTGLDSGLERGLERVLDRGLERGLERGLDRGLNRGLDRAEIGAWRGDANMRNLTWMIVLTQVRW